MNTKNLRVIAIALTLSGIAAPAAAYVPSTTNESGSRLKWMRSNCVIVRAHSAGSADVTNGSEFTAIERSVANWHTVIAGCAYMRIQLEQPAATATIGFDREGANENAVVFVESDWAHDKEAAGITTVFFVDNKESSQDGRILDADIELNGQFFKFNTTGAAGLTDVENTVTHELGHLLGLDHPCDDGTRSPVPNDHTGKRIPSCRPAASLPASMRESTMYNFAISGETKKRTPEDDDVLGVCETYPTASDPGSCAPIDFTDSGGCAIASAPPHAADHTPLWPRSVGLAAVLLALALMSRQRRRRRRRAGAR